jgi:hypothetical protein
MGERAELLRDVAAGVEAHHRDTGVGGLLQDFFERLGFGQADGDAVDFLVDGLLDELGLASAFGVGGVEQFDVVLGCGLLGALPYNVPEGIAGWGVGYHGDLDPCRRRCLASSGAAAGVGWLSTLA